jgi:hypothetical protein
MHPRPNAKMPKIINAKREYKNMAFSEGEQNIPILREYFH